MPLCEQIRENSVKKSQKSKGKLFAVGVIFPPAQKWVNLCHIK